MLRIPERLGFCKACRNPFWGNDVRTDMKRLAPWLLASALGLGLCPLPAGAAELPGPVVGRPAPPFTLTTTGGKHVSLADYRGKTLVINVWGSWCPPCRLETPDLIAEAKAGALRSVAFLGIDTTEPASAVRAFVAAKGIPYPQVATTADSEFARAYDIRNYPTTFVIDPSGVLRARHADNVLPRRDVEQTSETGKRANLGMFMGGGFAMTEIEKEPKNSHCTSER